MVVFKYLPRIASSYKHWNVPQKFIESIRSQHFLRNCAVTKLTCVAKLLMEISICLSYLRTYLWDFKESP